MRFSDNGNGTVTDNLTGLMWKKNANQAGVTMTWQQALDYVKTVNTGGYLDWRMPNRKEMRSLIDYSQLNPALPQGHPFTNVQQSSRYCESTSWQSTEDPPVGVWEVGMRDGGNFDGLKTANYNVWPVRCGMLSTTTTIIPTTTTITPSTTTSIQPMTTTSSTTTIIQPTTTTTEQTTLITLATFNAIPKSGKVILSWSTSSEIDNAGFNIYRAELADGQYAKINASLIPAKGSSTEGASYEFIDTNVQNRKTYYYKLEDIDLSGRLNNAWSSEVQHHG